MWRWPSRRRRIDDETRAEFEAHLALLTDRYVRAGMTPEDARVQARRQFGNVTWHREEIRSMNGIAWIDGLIQDLRYALRQVRRAPGFSAVVIATLALGIGGTTAVFSVLHAVLLAPLPYAEPGKLIRLYQQEPDRPDTRRAFSAPQFRMLRGEAASFDVGARYVREDLGLDIAHGGSPQRRFAAGTMAVGAGVPSESVGCAHSRRHVADTDRDVARGRLAAGPTGCAHPAANGDAGRQLTAGD